MPDTASLATYAQFFRIGLEAGICMPDEAREWALSVIERMDTPPGEIIEVSWRKPLEYLIADLNSVEGDADLESASKWLLRRLLESLPESNAKLRRVVRQAMQVARSIDAMDLYYDFDCVDDGLQLAATTIYGTSAECREGFETAIRQYLAPSA
jgi:hypothetical protein